MCSSGVAPLRQTERICDRYWAAFDVNVDVRGALIDVPSLSRFPHKNVACGQRIAVYLYTIDCLVIANIQVGFK